ncbi:Hypothetical protein FKW44_011463, partial [Caligus rogercresseyi]
MSWFSKDSFLSCVAAAKSAISHNVQPSPAVGPGFWGAYSCYGGHSWRSHKKIGPTSLN